jgi:hypothetical protein
MLESLPPMPLILQATVMVRDSTTYEIFKTSDDMDQCDNWRYFTGDIEQYAESEVRVSPLLPT